MLPEGALDGLTEAIDQVTAWLGVPVTVAVNCCCCPAPKATFGGLTLTISVPLLEPPKKAPLTTALTPPVQRTLILTWPERFQTRLTPSSTPALSPVSATAFTSSGTSPATS